MFRKALFRWTCKLVGSAFWKRKLERLNALHLTVPGLDHPALEASVSGG